jgi:hypothetical protein
MQFVEHFMLINDERRMMSSKDVLEQALELTPDERFMVIEGIIISLDEPDGSLDIIWADEAEKRLKAYRTIPLPISRARLLNQRVAPPIFEALALDEATGQAARRTVTSLDTKCRERCG